MQYLDLQLTAEPAPLADPDPCFGEPPAVFAPRSAAEFFGDLEEQLARAEVVRLVNPEWLRPADLRDAVDAILARLSRRGVRIESA